MGGELLLDRRVVRHGVGAPPRGELGGEVEHVHQQAGALHVREELVAEAGALGGALDQTRDVGHPSWRLSDSSTPSTGSSVVNG